MTLGTGANKTENYHLYTPAEVEEQLKRLQNLPDASLAGVEFTPTGDGYLKYWKLLDLAHLNGPTKIYRKPPPSTPGDAEAPIFYNLVVVQENYHARQCSSSERKELDFKLPRGLSIAQMADINEAADFTASETCVDNGYFHIPARVEALEKLKRYFRNEIATPPKVARNDRSAWDDGDLKLITGILEAVDARLPSAKPPETWSKDWWLEKSVEAVLTAITFSPLIAIFSPVNQAIGRLFGMQGHEAGLEALARGETSAVDALAEGKAKTPGAQLRELGRELHDARSMPKGVSIESKGHYSQPTLRFDQKQIRLLSRELGILESRIPHLLAKASGATTSAELANLVNERFTMPKLTQWLLSEPGTTWIRANHRELADIWQNRLAESGPGMLLALVGLLTAHELADIIGLDPVTQKEERFLFMVASGYGAEQIGRGIPEVLSQRGLRTSLEVGNLFQFVRTRANLAGGMVQYTLEARGTLGKALLDRLLGLSVRPGTGNVLWRGTTAVATCTGNAMGALFDGMGIGLAWGWLADTSVGNLFFKDDPKAREWLKLGGFTIPYLYKNFASGQRVRILEGRLAKWTGRIFATGLVADLGYGWFKRARDGNNAAAYDTSVTMRAWQRKQERGSEPAVAGAIKDLAPHIISDLAIPKQDADYQAVVAEDKAWALEVQTAYFDYVRTQLLNGEIADVERIDLSFLSSPLRLSSREAAYLEFLNQHADTFANLNPMDQVARFNQAFPHEPMGLKSFNRLRSQQMAKQLQTALQAMASLPTPETDWVREHCEKDGRVKAGHEASMVALSLGTDKPWQKELLEARRVMLAMDLMENPLPLQNPQGKKRAQAYALGLVNAQGQFIPSETFSTAYAALGQHHGKHFKTLALKIPVAHDNPEYAAFLAALSKALQG